MCYNSHSGKTRRRESVSDRAILLSSCFPQRCVVLQDRSCHASSHPSIPYKPQPHGQLIPVCNQSQVAIWNIPLVSDLRGCIQKTVQIIELQRQHHITCRIIQLGNLLEAPQSEKQIPNPIIPSKMGRLLTVPLPLLQTRSAIFPRKVPVNVHFPSLALLPIYSSPPTPIIGMYT